MSEIESLFVEIVELGEQIFDIKNEYPEMLSVSVLSGNGCNLFESANQVSLVYCKSLT